MAVLLIGQQGTGKTTLGQGLIDDASVARFVSGGVLIRREIARGSAIGRKIQPPIDAGDRIPPELMYQMLSAELDGDDSDLLVLDGFPGTATEHRELVAVTGEPELVLLLGGVPQDQLVQRLTERRVCPECHLTFGTDRKDRCKCGKWLQERPEDSALERIAKRHRFWVESEGDLIRLYEPLGVLVHLDARRSRPELRADARRAIFDRVKVRR